MALLACSASAARNGLRRQNSLIMSASDQCSAPLPKEGSSAAYGCLNFEKLADLAVTAALDKFGVNGKTNAWIKDAIKPVIEKVTSAASEKFHILEAEYCLGTFDSATITGASANDSTPM